MSVTIVTSPNAIVPVSNLVAMKLEGTPVTTFGVKAVLVLNFTGTPANGDTLQLDFGAFSVTLACNTIPNKTGYQFQPNIGGDPVNTYVQTYFIDQGFLSNPVLAEYFECVMTAGDAVSATVTITAKNTGSDYSLTVTNALSNVAVGSNTAGVTEVRRDNYRIYSWLYVENVWYSESYTRAIIQDSIPGADNRSVLYFEEVLRSYLSSDRPAFNATAIAAASNMLKRFYMRNGDSYGTPPVLQGLYKSGVFTAILAGLPKDQYPDADFVTDYCSSAAGRKLLTTQPRTKYLSELQQEYLYYYNDASSGNLVLKATAYFDDGTSSAETDMLTQAVTQPRIFIFPAGYTQLDIASINPAKTVVKYSLRLVHTSGSYSETMTYYVNSDYYEHNIYLLFRNSLGGFDTVWITGNPSFSNKTEQELFYAFLNNDYAAADGEFIPFAKSFAKGITVSLGYTNNSAAYLDYLQDLLLSDEVYLVGASDFYRIYFDLKEVNLYDEETSLFDLQLKLFFSFKNIAY